MAKVLVRKCPITGELYEDEGEYVKHLKKVRGENHIKFKKQDLLNFERETVQRMLRTCRSFDDISQFIKDNWKVFCARSFRYNEHTLRNVKDINNAKFPKLGSISFERMKFTCINNAHRAAQGIKPTASDSPHGYLAWTGVMVLSLDGEDLGVSTLDLFTDSGIYVSSGHGGKSTRVEIKLYLDEWTGLSEQATIDRLAGTNPAINKYYKNRD